MAALPAKNLPWRPCIVYDCQFYSYFNFFQNFYFGKYSFQIRYFFHIHNDLLSLQQSKSDGLCPKILKQLSFPHTRFPVQSASLSQSPSPISHLFDVVQQVALSLPRSLPSHPELDSMRGVRSFVNWFPYSRAATHRRQGSQGLVLG